MTLSLAIFLVCLAAGIALTITGVLTPLVTSLAALVAPLHTAWITVSQRVSDAYTAVSSHPAFPVAAPLVAATVPTLVVYARAKLAARAQQQQQQAELATLQTDATRTVNAVQTSYQEQLTQLQRQNDTLTQQLATVIDPAQYAALEQRCTTAEARASEASMFLSTVKSPSPQEMIRRLQELGYLVREKVA